MSLGRKLAAAAGIAVASVAIVATTVGTASADPLQPLHFSSAVDCQTHGNRLAQQGALQGFRCEEQNGEFLLYIW
jgi:hypothetical protein